MASQCARVQVKAVAKVVFYQPLSTPHRKSLGDPAASSQRRSLLQTLVPPAANLPGVANLQNGAPLYHSHGCVTYIASMHIPAFTQSSCKSEVTRSAGLVTAARAASNTAESALCRVFHGGLLCQHAAGHHRARHQGRRHRHRRAFAISCPCPAARAVCVQLNCTQKTCGCHRPQHAP